VGCGLPRRRNGGDLMAPMQVVTGYADSLEAVPPGIFVFKTVAIQGTVFATGERTLTPVAVHVPVTAGLRERRRLPAAD
jgi:hypothetical protein